nr:hypothetical protein [Tanacetum cinerariifolium]
VSDFEEEDLPQVTNDVPSLAQSPELVKTHRHSGLISPPPMLVAPPVPLRPHSPSKGLKRHKKTRFVCKSETHLIKDCDFHAKKLTQKSYASRDTHKHHAQMHHSRIPLHMVTTAARTIGAARPTFSKTRPHIAPYAVSKSKAPIRRLFIRHKSPKPNISSPWVNAANPSAVSAARVNAARLFTVSAARINPVQPSTVTAVQHNHTKKVWRPKTLVLDHVFRIISASMTLKRFDYNDALGRSKLGHVDFKTINKLVKGNFVRGLPSKVFTNDLSCVACKKGKQHRASCLENLLSLKVKIIRCDNGTEFKNADLNQFCGLKGIKREFSVPRTPQQNGIADKKNRTLIKAAKTLLADLLLPIPFWAEAVNTACYVQNRVLVTKPHNKTPYELLHGKVDEGFLVGYSVCSKAFRVFNSRTRIVQETLHVNFIENKPNIASSGPAWLFDIDSLTRTMNYHPVIAENQTNSHTGLPDTEKAGEEGTQTYVLFHVLSDGSTNPKNNKDAHTGRNKHNDNIQKSVSPDIHSSSCGNQAREQGDKAMNKDKGKNPIVTITGFRDLNEEFAKCINNSSNGGSAAGPSVSAAGLDFTNSTNDFTAAVL